MSIIIRILNIKSTDSGGLTATVICHDDSPFEVEIDKNGEAVRYNRDNRFYSRAALNVLRRIQDGREEMQDEIRTAVY